MRGLPLLATKTAEEAKALVSTGIETLGPRRLLARGGGWRHRGRHPRRRHRAGPAHEVADSLVGRVEPMLDAAGDDRAGRGFLADLAGIPIDQIRDRAGHRPGAHDLARTWTWKSSVDGAYGGATLDLKRRWLRRRARRALRDVRRRGPTLPQAPVQRQVIVAGGTGCR